MVPSYITNLDLSLLVASKSCPVRQRFKSVFLILMTSIYMENILVVSKPYDKFVSYVFCTAPKGSYIMDKLPHEPLIIIELNQRVSSPWFSS